MAIPNTHTSGTSPFSATGFESGVELIYGLNGRCMIQSIEKRTVSGQEIIFYKLQKIKNPLSKAMKTDLAIWVPASKAIEQGLRAVLKSDELEAVTRVLSSREYYFPIQTNWTGTHSALEAAINKEGTVGLAKAYSFLFVISHRQVVPTPEVNKMMEQVSKILFREVADAMGVTTKIAEEKINKYCRQKLIAAN
jgi:RNA polymerase-interacting CarD/CdnL/TRCF family regulator